MQMLASTGRTAPFQPALWTERPVNVRPGKERVGTRDEYAIGLPARAGEDRAAVRRQAIEALFRYAIFPEARMRAFVCTPDRRVAAGATIIQRVFLGPVCLEMAVRIVETFGLSEGEGKTGFSYVTVEGHVERGTATFAIDSRGPGGELVFRIESWSSPGNPLAWLGRPFARRMQRSSTDAALRHFRDHFRDAAAA